MEQYREIEVPKDTASYVAISHGSLVDAVYEHLDKAGFVVKDEKIQLAKFGNQMFGTVTCTTGDTEQDMTIGFRNSYDKSIPVGIVAGNRVIVCSNLMFKGDVKQMRKHTGSVRKELDFLVSQGVDYMVDQFEKIRLDTIRMKDVELTKRTTAELIGRMYIEENLITSTQVNIIKDQLTNSKLFTGESVWDLYNHTTEALKTSHPSTIMKDHIKVHNFMLELV